MALDYRSEICQSICPGITTEYGSASLTKCSLSTFGSCPVAKSIKRSEVKSIRQQLSL